MLYVLLPRRRGSRHSSGRKVRAEGFEPRSLTFTNAPPLREVTLSWSPSRSPRPRPHTDAEPAACDRTRHPATSDDRAVGTNDMSY
jgi:hypothetical protein